MSMVALWWWLGDINGRIRDLNWENCALNIYINVIDHRSLSIKFTLLCFQVWKYNEGEVTHVGLGHSGDITRVRVCPNSKHIISVSADGAILRWKYPFWKSWLDVRGEAKCFDSCCGRGDYIYFLAYEVGCVISILCRQFIFLNWHFLFAITVAGHFFALNILMLGKIRDMWFKNILD
jgi:WD40 repeat protein